MKPPALWPAIAIGWAIAALVLCVAMSRDIAGLWFPDPDDAMRLNQVRDLLAGQSWWDVGQHRFNNGDFAMHWSRLVDLPLAAVIGPLQPLFGTAIATRVAMVVVPLLTLLSVMALAAIITRRLLDTDRARTAVLLAPLSVPLIYQLRPMRIDHHGWQVTFALAAVLALLDKPTRRSGALLGLSLAVLVTISMEGMPIAAAIMGMAALAWAIEPARRDQMLAAIWAWCAGAVLLHVATRGPGMFAPACDAMSPAWIISLGVAALGMTLAALLACRTSPAVRIGALAVAAGGVGATLVLIAPDCLHGPFARLDPLVRTFWYEKVSEGMPVWEQVPVWAIATIGFPIFGLVGTVLAAREAQGEARGRWLMLLGVALAGFLLSVMVMRAGATANALAIPGGAWLLHALLVRARRIGPILPRTAATAGAFALAAPGLMATILLGLPVGTPAAKAGPQVATVAPCHQGHEVAALAALGSGRVFAPLDVSPEILATTRLSAIGAGYHRNDRAIHLVIATFMADPVVAHAAILRSHATWVAACPGVNETDMYKAISPNGLWAQLERGTRFDWLQPVPIAGSPVLVWRVIDPPHAR
ncbi:hypothetical protein QH494_20580 [Sphingomonas sp. AR_OL41]|uniref:hypothetical protein n=1 Tax=Sphingomonas sp. AR_OL41 TaxID=3042729 RepID=UPI00248011DF|nr:hypothetical protein [Sphingomonas sp. AR_OL41]MDH7974594.1 hypothetical protein [Sphingomonas sp. AR_OL41]